MKVLASALSRIGLRPLLFVALGGSAIVVVKMTTSPSLDQISPSEAPSEPPVEVGEVQPQGLPQPSLGFLPTVKSPESGMLAPGMPMPGLDKKLLGKKKKLPSPRRGQLSQNFWRNMKGRPPIIRPAGRRPERPYSNEPELAAAPKAETPAAAPNLGAVTSSPSRRAAPTNVAKKAPPTDSPPQSDSEAEPNEMEPSPPKESEAVESKNEEVKEEAVEVATKPVTAALRLASPFMAFFDLDCDVLASSVIDVINVKCFGAVGDGVRDDTDAINKALEQADRSKAVLFPKGTYIISDTLTLSGQVIVGESVSDVVLKVSDSVSSPINRMIVSIESPISLENMTLDANGADTGLFFQYSNGVHTRLENIVLKNAKGHGIHCQTSMSGSMRTVRSEGNGGDGFRFDGCTNFAAYNIEAINNKGAGIRVQGAVDSGQMGGGVYLNSGTVKAKEGGGIIVSGTTTRTVIKGMEIETMGDGVIVATKTRFVSLVDNRFRSSGGKGKAIHLKPDSFGCYVAGNYILNSGGSSSEGGFAQIDIEGVGNVVKGNYIEGAGKAAIVPVKYEKRNMIVDSGNSDALFNVIGFRKEKPDPQYKWRKGDTILNGGADEPYGWHCSETLNSKCEWLPFNKLEKIGIVGGPGL